MQRTRRGTYEGTRQIGVILYAKELSFRAPGVRGITPVMFSRDQLKRAASLTEEDFVQLGRGRCPHNRLGFAYQVGFVRLFDRFPQQQPFELFEELVCFSAAQLGLDAGLIELYRKRQPTISEHQQTITGYLRLRPFDDAEAAQLEQFLFKEACRLEQAAALMGLAREFFKEQRVLEPRGETRLRSCMKSIAMAGCAL